MSSNFQRCLAVVLEHEGGWVNDPRDPGGATMQGITLNTYDEFLGREATKAELHAIPDSDRDTIYLRNFWTPLRCEELPLGLALCLFDGAVVSGPHRSAQWLQQALEVTQDGSIGPATIGAAKACDQAITVKNVCLYRLQFLRTLHTWGAFGDGWGNRVQDTQTKALAFIKSP